MSRFVLGILRQAAEPLTTRDIALQMLLDRALDENDQKLLRLMTKRFPPTPGSPGGSAPPRASD